MGELIVFLIGAAISAIMAICKVTVPWPDLSWVWVLLPVCISLGVLIFEVDFD